MANAGIARVSAVAPMLVVALGLLAGIAGVCGGGCAVAQETGEMKTDNIPVETVMPSIHDRDRGKEEIAVDIPEVPHPFGKAPAVGVHPRVLVSPEDHERIRKAWAETPSGKRASASIRAWANNGISARGPLHEVYAGLVAGDLGALDKAKDNWWKAQLSLIISLGSFAAWVDEDEPRAQELAKALVTHARILGGKTVAHGPAVSGPDANMGMSYDFLYNYMTEEQRTEIRGVIAKATFGKKSHGMDLPDQGCTYNWMPHGMSLLLQTLSIEGEEGYDETILPQSVRVMRAFLTYGIDKTGVPREGMHYFNFGMGSGGARAMVAFARRGVNLFGHPHYRMTKNWYVQGMEPFGYAFSQHGDTSNDGGGILDNYTVMHYVFGDDPVVDFVWRNRIHDDYTGLSYRGDFLAFGLFPSDWKANASVDSKIPVADQWGVDNAPEIKAAAEEENADKVEWRPDVLGQPLSWYSPDRGFLTTRSAWGKDALALHFESKMDEGGPSHSHANRNDFTLSADGVKWAVDRGFHICESKHHNVILVDGQGEGSFCGSGEVVSYIDSPIATVIRADATEAYRWRYTFTGRTNNPENKGYAWEATDKQNTSRAPNIPMQSAVRTAALVRGQYPYALIADSIRQDDNEHLYEWLMQVPGQRELISINGNDAILEVSGTSAEKNNGGKPRLLVRALHVSSCANNRDSDRTELFSMQTYQGKRSANTGSKEVWNKELWKRLVVSSRSNDPRFLILLYPHREGDELPQTSWSEDGKALTVIVGEQSDLYQFPDAGGSTQGWVMSRGDTIVCQDVSAVHATGFGCEAETGTANLVWQGGTLYVSGAGWKSLTVTEGDLQKVCSDGSVASCEKTPAGYRLVERQ